MPPVWWISSRPSEWPRAARAGRRALHMWLSLRKFGQPQHRCPGSGLPSGHPRGGRGAGHRGRSVPASPEPEQIDPVSRGRYGGPNAIVFLWELRRTRVLREHGLPALLDAAALRARRTLTLSRGWRPPLASTAPIAGLPGATGSPRRPEGLCRSCRLTRTAPGRPRSARPRSVRRGRGRQATGDRAALELGLPGVEPGALAFDLLSSDVRAGDHRARRRRDHDRPRRVRRRAARSAQRPSSASPTARCSATCATSSATSASRAWSHDAANGTACRELFGDERTDYAEALERHYEEGPPPDWAEHHVSAYATMHPWEDWAETFAHYLHIRDTLQTAARVRRRRSTARAPSRATTRSGRAPGRGDDDDFDDDHRRPGCP